MSIITQKEFNAICKKCDEILLSKNSGFSRVGIPFLHVVRGHPFFLKNYLNLFRKKKKKLLLIKNILSIIFFFIKHLLYLSSFEKQKKKIKEVDVLVISHLVSKENFDDEKDFYFGFFNELDNFLICLINHTKFSANKIIKNKKSNKFVLENFVGIFNELRILKLLTVESLKLVLEGFKENDYLKRKILFRASKEAFSSGSRSSLRIGIQIEKLVLITNPKVLLITFEGYAWERIAFSSARKANHKIKCIGYQQAAIFKNSHSIFRDLEESFNPNFIFSASKNMKKQIIEKYIHKKEKIYVLGSVRKEEKILFKSLGKSCLVTPEGNLDECKLMFGFSLQCAIENPEMNFIWRMHPIITFEELFKRCPDFRNLPSNILISKKDFKHDINLSKAIIYRGSTSIIEATRYGLIPIYLAFKKEISIDPLYSISKGKFIVSSTNELVKIFKTGKSNTKIVQYCDRFYDTYNSDLLPKFL